MAWTNTPAYFVSLVNDKEKSFFVKLTTGVIVVTFRR
jgi:hypothetical protein